MKFLTVAAVSFSLSCQVLGAPIVPSVPTPVAGIATQVETVPTEALTGIEAVPGVSTLTGAVTSLTSDTGLSLPKRSIDITTITTSISTLKSSISPELTAITTLSVSTVTTTVVPEIKSHLEAIATYLHSTVESLAPALVVSVLSLTADEAQALHAALADLETIVFNLKTTLSSTLATVKSDVVTLIQPEIATVLGLVLPLLGPVTTFVYSIAGLVPGGDAAVAELTSAAGTVLAVAGPLLGPVEGLAGVAGVAL